MAIKSRLDEVEPITLPLRYMLKEDKNRIVVFVLLNLSIALLLAMNIESTTRPLEASAWTIFVAYIICSAIVHVLRYRRHYRSGLTKAHRCLIERNVLLGELKKRGLYYAGAAPGDVETRTIRWSHTGQPIRREDFVAGMDPSVAALEAHPLQSIEVDAKNWAGPHKDDLITIVEELVAGRMRYIEQPYAPIEELDESDETPTLVDFSGPSEGDNAAQFACFGSILIVRIYEAPQVLAAYHQGGGLMELLMWGLPTLFFAAVAVSGGLNLMRGERSLLQKFSSLLIRIVRFFWPADDPRNR